MERLNRFDFTRYLFLTTILLTVACTRQAPTTSQLQLDLGAIQKAAREKLQNKIGSLAVGSATIGHIVVNVRGPAGELLIPPYNWDGNCHCAENIMLPAPTSLELSVPSGDGRLIQVLVVAEDPTTRVMQFMYGDGVATVSGTSSSVSIEVVPVGTGTASDAEVAGRWIDANGAGPTGELVMEFQPVAGRPPVEIMTKEIFAGWFQVFVVDGAPFRFRFKDTTNFLFDSLSKSGDSLLVNGVVKAKDASFLQIVTPAYYHKNGPGSTSCSLSDPHSTFIGFFGPGASSKAVKFPTTTAAIQYSYNSQAACDASSTTNASYIQWIYNSTSTADIRRIGAGGNPAATGTAYVDYIPLQAQNLTRGRGAAGFEGPFRITGTNNSTLSVAQAGDVITVSWELLPGVATSSGVSGLEIFLKELTATESVPHFEGEGGFSCSDLPVMGFKSVGDVTDLANVTSKASSGYAANTRAVAVACPYTNTALGRRYFTSVAAGEIFSGIASSAPPTHVVVTASSTTLGYNSCVPVQLKLLDSNNQPAWFVSPQAITMSVTGGASLSNDPLCSSALSTLNFPSYMTTQDVYVKAPASGTSGTLSVAAFASVPASTAITLTFQTNGAVSKYAIFGSPNLMNYECAGFVLQQQTASGAPSAALSSGSISLTASVGGGQFYSDMMCTTSVSIISAPPSGQSNAVFYYKNTSTSGAVTLTATKSGVTGSISSTLSAPGPASAISVRTLPNIAAGDCRKVDLVSVDNQWHDSPGTTNTSVNLYAVTDTATMTNVSGVHFYSNSACTSTITSTVISAGTILQTIYVKADAAVPAYLVAKDVSNTLTAEAQLVSFDSILVQAIHSGIMAPLANLVVGQCVAVQINLSSSGQSYLAGPNGFSVNLVSSSSMLSASSSCSAPVSSMTVTIPSGQSSATLYVKPAVLSLAETITASGTGVVTNNFTFKANQVFFSIVPNASVSYSSGCEPMKVGVRDANSVNVTPDIVPNLRVSSVVFTGNFTTSDPTCNSGMTPNVVVVPGTMVYFRPSSAGSGSIVVQDDVTLTQMLSMSVTGF